MVVETFTSSLWSSLTPKGQKLPWLRGSVEADVLVVGAGMLGLSHALHLAETGAHVVVLEAQEVGFGASGRNTGFVVPSLRSGLSTEDLDERLGQGRGARLMRLVSESGDTVFDLIRRLGLDCAAEQSGWLQPAHSAAMAPVLEKRVRAARGRGGRVDMLDAKETARRIGTDGFHGALLDHSGGQINPLAYARGLARAGIDKGVAIHELSPVTGIVREAPMWRATTEDGTVRAPQVLFTTNALIGRFMPELADSIVPARAHQIATQIFPEDVRQRIIPERNPIADTRRHTFAVRWSPDGRLVTGGLMLPGPRLADRTARTFTRRLERFFPDIGRVKAEFIWNGVIAVTTDSLPRFISLGPGLDAVIGCNGRGVALTTALGREIAHVYAGRLDMQDFALPHRPPVPVPGRRLAQIGPHLWLPWSNLRDRWEGGR